MKFSDPIDQGSHLAELHNQSAIAAHAKKMLPEQTQVEHVAEDGTITMVWPQLDCEDCGLEIEEHRLANARIRCHVCQTLKEKREKSYAPR